MSSSERLHAVVLRRVPYGESDLIVHFFTREAGRLSALARGARRSKKRFGGALGLFAVVRVDLRNRKNSELWSANSAELVQSFQDIALDVVAMAHASYGTELVRELSAPEVADAAVFDLLVELYESVACAGPRAGRLRVFELRLLELMGLAPILDRCARCGDRAMGNALIDPAGGGALCRPCAGGARGAVRELPTGARSLLCRAQRMECLAEGDILDGDDEAGDARAAMLATLYSHVGKPLRSVEFIAKLSGAG